MLAATHLNTAAQGVQQVLLALKGKNSRSTLGLSQHGGPAVPPVIKGLGQQHQPEESDDLDLPNPTQKCSRAASAFGLGLGFKNLMKPCSHSLLLPNLKCSLSLCLLYHSAVTRTPTQKIPHSIPPPPSPSLFPCPSGLPQCWQAPNLAEVLWAPSLWQALTTS